MRDAEDLARRIHLIEPENDRRRRDEVVKARSPVQIHQGWLAAEVLERLLVTTD